ncbi:ferredoxin oxidoreductase [Patescibacteria group bacterium]|nr:ferredoxin oxidoreductase [Patescibacteria group bacterium]MBU1722210.1 ferredoxin oxidoreductase [Patescibacteria group bacterium]MBU1901161.1 ferredoxin oxidoreductase [Patescibacteria group bacterium]
MKRQFLTGHEVAVLACIDAGATHMFGYPITPGTEILTNWIHHTQKNKALEYLQTEDEIAAGFAVCGAVMAGEKTFTATAGPGTVLMQDALSMADGMRLPFVCIVAQRGGPSSGTVIYSQQEVNLAIHGGNGEGMRLVYSPSTVQELYDMTRKTFNGAWKYRFPSVVLTDGFLLKTRQDVVLNTDYPNVEAEPLVHEKEYKHIRNIYTVEEELYEVLQEHKRDFDAMAKEVADYEAYKTEDAEVVIVAHGIVGAATKAAVDMLRESGKKVGLFRPKTLSPFPAEALNNLAEHCPSLCIVESSMGQLRDLVKQALTVSAEIHGLYKPAVGIDVEEIVSFIQENYQ